MYEKECDRVLYTVFEVVDPELNRADGIWGYRNLVDYLPSIKEDTLYKVVAILTSDGYIECPDFTTDLHQRTPFKGIRITAHGISFIAKGGYTAQLNYHRLEDRWV